MRYINIKSLGAFALTALMLASCQDFLEVAPESSLTTTTFFKTDADFVQGVNSIYEQLHDVYGVSSTDNPGSGAWIMGEMRSDNTHYILNTGNRGFETCEYIDNFVDDKQNGYSNNKYYNNFILISRANQVIAQLETASITESVAANVKGQALFLRALSYLDLVQYFGDVPMPLTPATNMAETALPRTAKADIFAQIIKDATEAASLLPNKATQDKGRATSGAAKMLLANAYVVLKDWAKVETNIKSILSEYSLLTKYSDIYEISNKNNAESIFEVQFMQGATQGQRSNFIYNFLPRLSDPSIVTGVAGSANSQGGWNTPTPDMIAAYEAGDIRKDASIAYVEGYPYIKKYSHAHSIWNNTDDNWPVYRFSEALLFLAEALNEQAKPAEALPYLNQVRTRAGLTSVTETGQVALRDRILKERRVELAFENKRWLDIVRTGKMVEIMTAHGAKIKATPMSYYYPAGYQPVASAYTGITAAREIFPIPYREIQLNPALTQNAGY